MPDPVNRSAFSRIETSETKTRQKLILLFYCRFYRKIKE